MGVVPTGYSPCHFSVEQEGGTTGDDKSPAIHRAQTETRSKRGEEQGGAGNEV